MYKRILAVDDEPNILTSLGRTLQEWLEEDGIQFLTRSDPSTVLFYLESIEGHVDLLISDLRMPGTKGSELIGQVHERWPQIPVIVLTGFAETEETIRAVRAGIINYITKPWDPATLISVLKKAMEAIRLREEHDKDLHMLSRELEMAGQLQRNLLRVNLSAQLRLRCFYTYQPVSALHCGGDYLDIIELGGGRDVVLVGDVSGHGLTGALITGILKSVIYPEFIRQNMPSFSPAALLNWLDARLAGTFGAAPGLFISMVALLVEETGHRVVWASAGHCPPILCRGGACMQLTATGAALGAHGATRRVDRALDLKSGDSLWVFTDGLVEAGAADIVEGIGGLAEAIVASEGQPRETRHQAITRMRLAATGGMGFTDDVTLVSFYHD